MPSKPAIRVIFMTEILSVLLLYERSQKFHRTIAADNVTVSKILRVKLAIRIPVVDAEIGREGGVGAVGYDLLQVA